MQCRHTVPDWHRYVSPTAEPALIFAGCRLLVREGEPASDPRRIACTYWGRQRDCPLYEGPDVLAKPLPVRPAESPSEDIPVAVQAVWPVRPPGGRDGMRLLLMGMGVLSAGLLAWAMGLGLSVLNGRAPSRTDLPVVVVAATVSIVTHVLAVLRTWARR